MTAIFALGVATLRCPANPARELRGALKKAPKVQHRASLKPEDLPDYFERFAELRGDPATRAALALDLLTVVRVSELVGARWDEIDLDGAMWCIPPERMKMDRGHLVPLSTQAVALLRDMRPLSGSGELVFPSPSNPHRPISGNALLLALRRMVYAPGDLTAAVKRKVKYREPIVQLTVHGFRSTFSTWAHESGFDSDVIEVQLSHVDKNNVRAAYNNAQYMEKRRLLLQAWADTLDAKREGAEIVPIKRKAG